MPIGTQKKQQASDNRLRNASLENIPDCNQQNQILKEISLSNYLSYPVSQEFKNEEASSLGFWFVDWNDDW